MAFPDVMAFRLYFHRSQSRLMQQNSYPPRGLFLSEFMASIERFASSTDDPWAESAKRPLKTHEFTKKYYAAGLAILLQQSGLATARVYAHREWQKCLKVQNYE